MQTVCRPTPEPNAAAYWVKNSPPSLPTPFSAGLFLTQNIYGAWFTAEPPPHCTHQDESTQRSSSTTEPLSTACSHPACCTEAEDLGSIWQHTELSTGGHNGVFLCLMETLSWERSKLRRSRAALPHTATELRLVATPVWRLGRGTVELGPSSPMLSLGEVPWEGGTSPCTHTDTKHPHTCSSSICAHHPRADRRWPTKHGKKHRAAVRVCLPLIRGTVVTAPGPGRGKNTGAGGTEA